MTGEGAADFCAAGAVLQEASAEPTVRPRGLAARDGSATTTPDSSELNVFYVHSAITYLVTLAAVDHLALPAERVVILFARGFRTATDLPCLAYPFPVGQNYFGQTHNPMTFCRRAREFRTFLDGLAGPSPMAWYLPQTSLSMFPLLRADWRLRSFSLIEEGTANYSGNPTYRLPMSQVLRPAHSLGRAKATAGRAYRTLLGKVLVGPRWSDERSFFDPAYRTCFVVSRAAMQGYHRRAVLDLRASARVEELCRTYSSCFPEEPDVHVLALDAAVEFGWITEEDFWGFWGRVQSYLDAKGVRRLLVKRHPHQVRDDWFWRRFLDAVSADRKSPALTVLPDDTILEIELLKAATVTLVTSGSSLAVYAGMFGADVKGFPIAHQFGAGE